MTHHHIDPSEYFGIQSIGLTKQFGGVKALDNVTLTIPIFGITSADGPNGYRKLWASMIDCSKADHRGKTEETFKKVGMWERRDSMAVDHSYGQQQMLAIGRGLMAGPDVLLLDEPTLGLAPIIVSEVFEKVSEISQTLNTTIMVVEHNIKGILEIADRAYVLNNGRIAHDGTPLTVQETDILTDVFLGRVADGEL